MNPVWDVTHVARVVDLFTMAFVFGSTAWFFFIQSPVLLAQVGRAKFVPMQMRLTVALFRSLVVASLVMFAAALVHGPLVSTMTIAAGVAVAGAVVNKYVVVPRALEAGGRSRSALEGKDHEGSTAGFAADGAGARTRLMHRLVVAFVVLMLGGAVAHGVALLG